MRASTPTLLALLALGSLGCQSDLTSRLQACGIVSQGELPRSPFYAPTACYEACLAEASCQALEAAWCRTELSLLLECDRRCAYACDDGALLAVEQVCDGVESCEGGEDERDCPVHVCDDGQELLGDGHRCDGVERCRDGSDERGCPEHVCGDGETLPAARRCDGWAACRDGSDEEGCAEVTLRCEG
ncbi:MAG TPA: LDL receptor domain-containing protein [Sandaracinaceae bacterium LLY-WYZ-13_1]|nr:LDL receptor domain-containing protein [Sandaracinaceae bacterium LLY-WYZ-13_1]